MSVSFQNNANLFQSPMQLGLDSLAEVYMYASFTVMITVRFYAYL